MKESRYMASKVKINAKDSHKSYQVTWDRFFRAVYSRYRNYRITYAMHQMAAIATARRAEMRRAPRFAVCRRARA